MYILPMVCHILRFPTCLPLCFVFNSIFYSQHVSDLDREDDDKPWDFLGAPKFPIHPFQYGSGYFSQHAIPNKNKNTSLLDLEMSQRKGTSNLITCNSVQTSKK